MLLRMRTMTMHRRPWWAAPGVVAALVGAALTACGPPAPPVGGPVADPPRRAAEAPAVRARLEHKPDEPDDDVNPCPGPIGADVPPDPGPTAAPGGADEPPKLPPARR